MAHSLLIQILSPITLQPGDQNDVRLVAPWPSVVQNLVTVKVYNQTNLLTSAKHTFAVDMYNDIREFFEDIDTSTNDLV